VCKRGLTKESGGRWDTRDPRVWGLLGDFEGSGGPQNGMLARVGICYSKSKGGGGGGGGEGNGHRTFNSSRGANIVGFGLVKVRFFDCRKSGMA